jgi:hypothetical protein
MLPHFSGNAVPVTICHTGTTALVIVKSFLFYLGRNFGTLAHVAVFQLCLGSFVRKFRPNDNLQNTLNKCIGLGDWLDRFDVRNDECL